MNTACKGTLAFLRAHKHNLGALTGQDARALAAIAHCWELYAMSDSDGQEAALRAIKALLGAMQPHTRPLAREAIAYTLDWGDRDRLWPRVEFRHDGNGSRR
jgi:hypothetical protein